MVSIAAFQAVDPGSIPGRRNIFVQCSVLSARQLSHIKNSKVFFRRKSLQKVFRYRELNPGHLGESQVS